MKGATDGGLDVPHNEKRFPGYDRDTKSYDVSAAQSQRNFFFWIPRATWIQLTNTRRPETRVASANKVLFACPKSSISTSFVVQAQCFFLRLLVEA